MATITYVNPDKLAPEGSDKKRSVNWNGYDFEEGKAVEVDDPVMVAKARNNPNFKVSGKGGDEEAEIVGDYVDPTTGGEVTLIHRQKRQYTRRASPDDVQPAPPTAATQMTAATPVVNQTVTTQGDLDRQQNAKK